MQQLLMAEAAKSLLWISAQATVLAPSLSPVIPSRLGSATPVSTASWTARSSEDWTLLRSAN